MKLYLTISGKVLASTTVAPFIENSDYFLKAFRRQLILRYHAKLRSQKNAPSFILEMPMEERRAALRSHVQA